MLQKIEKVREMKRFYSRLFFILALSNLNE